MSKNFVVKTNQLNTAIQNLEKSEIRIIQLAIVDARETNTGLSAENPLRLDASRYAEVFGFTRQNAYQRMKEAEETLFNRRFTFIDKDGKPVKSRWVQQVKYLDEEGAIELVFTIAVIKGISRINGAEDFFTSYLLEQTVALKSVYSIRLYELLTQFRAMKKATFELEKMRGQLGIGVNEYKLMSNFKLRVLDLAVNEINEISDLKVSYENVKKGRKIVGFDFKILVKKDAKESTKKDDSRDENTPDLFHKMTDKQVNFFGAKLANDSAFGSKHAKQGEDIKAFEYRIKQELTNIDNQQKWSADLKRLGYNPKAKKGE